MDDDLRTVIMDGLELFGSTNTGLEYKVENLYNYLNEKGYAIYDERYDKPFKV